jgi:hypothetical protein
MTYQEIAETLMKLGYMVGYEVLVTNGENIIQELQVGVSPILMYDEEKKLKSILGEDFLYTKRRNQYIIGIKIK